MMFTAPMCVDQRPGGDTNINEAIDGNIELPEGWKELGRAMDSVLLQMDTMLWRCQCTLMYFMILISVFVSDNFQRT